jgi:hypothetical protein
MWALLERLRIDCIDKGLIPTSGEKAILAESVLRSVFGEGPQQSSTVYSHITITITRF